MPRSLLSLAPAEPQLSAAIDELLEGGAGAPIVIDGARKAAQFAWDAAVRSYVEVARYQ